MGDSQFIKRWCFAAVYGLIIYSVLPSVVVVYNDDFGYLRSVVETLQHGRPWTDDWLEPWSASLSGISALFYWVSGNFYLATYGLLAALSMTAFGAAASHFFSARFQTEHGARIGRFVSDLSYAALERRGI